MVRVGDAKSKSGAAKKRLRKGQDTLTVRDMKSTVCPSPPSGSSVLLNQDVLPCYK